MGLHPITYQPNTHVNAIHRNIHSPINILIYHKKTPQVAQKTRLYFPKQVNPRISRNLILWEIKTHFKIQLTNKHETFFGLSALLNHLRTLADLVLVLSLLAGYYLSNGPCAAVITNFHHLLAYLHNLFPNFCLSYHRTKCWPVPLIFNYPLIKFTIKINFGNFS